MLSLSEVCNFMNEWHNNVEYLTRFNFIVYVSKE